MIIRWALGISSKLLALCVLGFFMRCPYDGKSINQGKDRVIMQRNSVKVNQMLIWKQLQAKDNFTSQFRYYPPSTNPVWRIKQKREKEYIRRLQIQSEHFKLPKTYTTSLSISIFGDPYFCFLILNRHINRKAPFLFAT